MRKLFLSAATLLSITTIQAQDWRTDESVKTITSSNFLIKMELLKHKTPEGQARVRVTNLGCKTDVYITFWIEGRIKNMDQGQVDSANFDIDPDNADGIMYVAPLINCNGGETDIYSTFVDYSWLEPAIIEVAVAPPVRRGVRRIASMLSGIPLIIRVGIPNNIRPRIK